MLTRGVMTRWSLATRRRWATHIFTVLVIAAWAIGSSGVPSYLFPDPVTVFHRSVEFFLGYKLFSHVVASVTHVLVSLTLAFLLGGALALMAHYVPVTRAMVHGRITPFLNSFSSVGWTLLAILWFGLNTGTVIFAITAIILPVCIINLQAGLESIDAEMAEMGRSFTRNWGRYFRLLVLPAMIPFMFATVRISFGVAWKVALTAELFGGNSGFGFVINLARQSFDSSQIFAVITIIVVIYVITDNLVLAPIQRRLVRHYADD
ncbi:MAG: ABC transporter permease subunit [Rhizobiales bacterium]|nr:ABC transporter permease subunit [Hyphomicrobiales bacterium]